MYCISCGKRGNNTYPKSEPLACSMTCLCRRVINEYKAGGDGFFCNTCGKEISEHQKDCYDNPV